uniref:CDI domain-containing protein n=1 Tax=Steinernema glaseri TaxID=37863 RepID=A0A1I8ACJ5_9BILA
MYSVAPPTPRKRQFKQETTVPDSNKAKRRLFQVTATEEDEAYIQRELSSIAQEKQQKWNFDFVKGCPLPSSSEDSYTFNCVPESDVPLFYRNRRDSGFDSSFDSENKCPDSDVSSNDEATFSTPAKKARKCVPAKRRSSTATPKKDLTKKMTDFMPLRRKIPSSPKDTTRRRSLGAVSSPVSSQ